MFSSMLLQNWPDPPRSTLPTPVEFNGKIPTYWEWTRFHPMEGNQNLPITAEFPLNLRTLHMHQGLFNGLLYVFYKLQDRLACRVSNAGLQLLDLARFRARLVWSGNSAPGSLQALTHLWQWNNAGGWRGSCPKPCAEGLHSNGKVPPLSHGHHLPC